MQDLKSVKLCKNNNRFWAKNFYSNRNEKYILDIFDPKTCAT